MVKYMASSEDIKASHNYLASSQLQPIAMATSVRAT
jgi:hypothetical protein